MRLLGLGLALGHAGQDQVVRRAVAADAGVALVPPGLSTIFEDSEDGRPPAGTGPGFDPWAAPAAPHKSLPAARHAASTPEKDLNASFHSFVHRQGRRSSADAADDPRALRKAASRTDLARLFQFEDLLEHKDHQRLLDQLDRLDEYDSDETLLPAEVRAPQGAVTRAQAERDRRQRVEDELQRAAEERAKAARRAEVKEWCAKKVNGLRQLQPCPSCGAGKRYFLNDHPLCKEHGVEMLEAPCAKQPSCPEARQKVLWSFFPDGAKGQVAGITAFFDSAPLFDAAMGQPREVQPCKVQVGRQIQTMDGREVTTPIWQGVVKPEPQARSDGRRGTTVVRAPPSTYMRRQEHVVRAGDSLWFQDCELELADPSGGAGAFYEAYRVAHRDEPGPLDLSPFKLRIEVDLVPDLPAIVDRLRFATKPHALRVLWQQPDDGGSKIEFYRVAVVCDSDSREKKRAIFATPHHPAARPANWALDARITEDAIGTGRVSHLAGMPRNRHLALGERSRVRDVVGRPDEPDREYVAEFTDLPPGGCVAYVIAVNAVTLGLGQEIELTKHTQPADLDVQVPHRGCGSWLYKCCVRSDLPSDAGLWADSQDAAQGPQCVLRGRSCGAGRAKGDYYACGWA